MTFDLEWFLWRERPAVTTLAVLALARHFEGDKHIPKPGEDTCPECFAVMERVAPGATFNDWQDAMHQPHPREEF